MRRALLFAALAAACGSRSVSVPNHDPGAPAIAGLHRDGEGAFTAGSVERLTLIYSVEDTEATIRWTASAGQLVIHGDTVDWTLPDAEEATLTAALVTQKDVSTSTFHFRLASTAVTSAASGAVDGSSDATGSACDLAIRADGTPALVYRNDTHPGVWYATWNGAAWQTQLVDGMGYEVGGAVAKQIALAVASDGTPHVAYALENSQVWYAVKGASGWTRERVDGTIPRITSSTFRHLGLALDPANGSRPTIMYTSSSGAPVLAARTAPGTWSNTSMPATYTYSSVDYFVGGLAIAPSGTVYYTVSNSGLRVAAYTGSGAPRSIGLGGVYLWGDYYGYALLAVDGNGNPVAMGGQAVGHVVPGATIDVGSVTVSPYEESVVGVGDIAFSGGKPFLAYNHGGSLEIATPNASGYWTYTNLGGTTPSEHIGVAVDASGIGHACFLRDSKIQYQ